MATSTNKTVKPTGLSVTRSGNTYTFKWKQGDKDYRSGQQLQYRLRNADNAWTKVNIGVAAVSASITNANVTFLQFRVAGKRSPYRKGRKTIKPLWSDWAVSGAWTATVPARPSLEYENISTNCGLFKWNTAVKSDDRAVFDNVVVQTQLRRDNAVNPANGTWTTVSGSAASGSVTITEQPENLAAGAFIRWVRVKSHGNAGDSAWTYVSHAYGTAVAANLISASAEKHGPTSRITAEWSSSQSRKQPIDKLTVQYAIGVPADTNMYDAPSSGWQDAVELTAASGNDKIVVNVDDSIRTDECMWVRIKTEHDGLASYSRDKVAQIGTLAAPTINAVPNFSAGTVAITITEETSCDVADTAIFYRSEADPSNDQIIAVFRHGTTSGTISVPDLVGRSSSCFGAFSFLGSSSGLILDVKMRSAEAIDSDIGAVAPENVTIKKGPRDGTVRIGWQWTWEDATSAELAWADHEEAWESTDEPSTYRVNDRNAVNWVIAGLESGKRWFFRVRLIGEQDGEELVGPWSAIASYDVSSVPDRPVLTLSKDVINAGDSVTARWAYAVGKDTGQAYAEIAIVTTEIWGIIGDPEADLEETEELTYTTVAYTDVDQEIEFTYDWETDHTYDFAVRVTTSSGTQSEWSDPVTLTVVRPLSIGNVTTSLAAPRYYKRRQTTKTETFVDGECTGTSSSSTDYTFNPEGGLTKALYDDIFNDDPVTTMIMGTGSTRQVLTVTQEIVTITPSGYLPTLTALPLTVTFTSFILIGTIILSIVRDEDYHVYRPDEKDYDGFEGETVYTRSQVNSPVFTINKEDLASSLDNGARYRMLIDIIDKYGQKAHWELPFIVDWSHKAGVPSAVVETDESRRISMITPAAPENFEAGDTCDIYRITADRPELVYKGASFGETYVDPYPAFGDFCGHRIVTVTANGDYASDDGLAWYDTGVDDGDLLEEKKMIIDVDGDQIELPYNIELSNSWNKDFERTEYLGGSVQGDWNPAVTRDLAANTVLLRGRDVDQQLSMRDLAGYAGVCHIRTPDGSSMACDIQVRESMDYKTKRVSYTLTVRAVDPGEPDGMTLEEWEERYPEEEEAGE